MRSLTVSVRAEAALLCPAEQDGHGAPAPYRDFAMLAWLQAVVFPRFRRQPWTRAVFEEALPQISYKMDLGDAFVV